MKNLFLPAISLMNQFRIPHKFLGQALVSLVTITALGYFLATHLIQVITTSEQGLEGIALIRPLTSTVLLLQVHRGLTNGLLAGDESLRTPLASNTVDLEAALGSLSTKLSKQSTYFQDWRSIQIGLEDIRKNHLNWNVTKSFVAHTHVLDQMQTLRRRISDHQSLTVGPDIGTKYLLDTAIVEIPVVLEKIGQIRALGTAILVNSEFAGDQKLAMAALIAELQAARKALSFNLGEAALYNPVVGEKLTNAFKSFDARLLRFIDQVQADIMAEHFETRAGNFFKTATGVIENAHQQLHEVMLPAAENLIIERMRRAEEELYFSAGIALLLMLVVGYLVAGIYYSAADGVQVLARAARRFESGDLLHRVNINTRDELGQIGNSFNRMADGFHALFSAQVESDERLRAIIGSALDAIVQMNSEGIISGWSSQAEKCFGWSREDVVGRPLHETIIPLRYRERHLRGLSHFLVTGDGPVMNTRVEIEGLHRDGHEFPVELSISSIQTREGVEFSAFIRDITERKVTEGQLRKLSLAVEQSPESIIITNLAAKIEYVNEAFVQNSGYGREEAIGNNPRMLQSGGTPAETYTSLWNTMALGQSWKGEFCNKRKDGSEYLELAVISPIRQPDGHITHYVAVKEDITSRKAAEKEIYNLAYFDSLTGLPNRRLLHNRLKHTLASIVRKARYGALLLIDLDNFKDLNDNLGHDIGDLLLQQVAQRLVTCVREGDTVARLGGDEFVVMLEDLSQNSQEAAAQAKVVGEKILAALNRQYQVATHLQHSTPSIGVTLFADHLGSVDDLLKRADLAMYQAKDAGRNTLRFFDLAMQTVVATRAALEADLRIAVEEGQFLLHYQAQVAGDGRVTGAEVLLRWWHPDRGLVSPAEFIPLAEDTGLILPLGRWVLQSACGQLAIWARRPEMADLTIAVNVSARQFRLPNFVEIVLAVLEDSGANPRRLKLELTESLLVEDVEDIIVKMNALKAKGVGFSMDDFGTGYSSLSYLKRLPLDQLKIDQGFVNNILTDPNDAAIAKMVVVLAESMGLAVIAEGVETQAQRDFLALHGCHAYQGYLFSRPIPLGAFEAYVSELGTP